MRQSPNSPRCLSEKAIGISCALSNICAQSRDVAGSSGRLPCHHSNDAAGGVSVPARLADLAASMAPMNPAAPPPTTARRVRRAVRVHVHVRVRANVRAVNTPTHACTLNSEWRRVQCHVMSRTNDFVSRSRSVKTRHKSLHGSFR